MFNVIKPSFRTYACGVSIERCRRNQEVLGLSGNDALMHLFQQLDEGVITGDIEGHRRLPGVDRSEDRAVRAAFYAIIVSNQSFECDLQRPLALSESSLSI